ncbi:hypothetical protein Psuf_042570 [Phytohabitans suffuscus]|uniref:Uncharacterized protein n=1 Tax=Phytohabitans suffuscus TaxID=624315 RepID=A0A6F8YLE9_9ACTN|nr:hypothetical protein Psuf_042570 [Phytohabitans suffuscus]
MTVLRPAVPEVEASGDFLDTHPEWAPTRALGRAVLVTGLLLIAGVLAGRVDLVVLAIPFALGTAVALHRRPGSGRGSRWRSTRATWWRAPRRSPR